MVTYFRRKLMNSLFLVSTAWFGVQGCSSEQEEDNLLDPDQQEEAAEIDYDATAPIDSGEEASSDTVSDIPSIGDGMPSDTMGTGDGLDTGLPTPGGLPSDLATGLENDAEEAADDLAGPGAGAMAPGAMGEAMDATGSEEFFKYTIVSGDWLSKIAGRVYGDIYKWPSIASANPEIANPDLIYPGNVIKVPITGPSSRAFAQSYKGTASVTPKEDVHANAHLTQVVVQSGDTLCKIAERLLGSASAWTKVWEQNKSAVSNPDMIAVGQVLTIDLNSLNSLAMTH